MIYKSGPLKVIGQFSRDGIGSKTLVTHRSHWLVLVSLDPSFVSLIVMFEVRLLLVKLSRSV